MTVQSPQFWLRLGHSIASEGSFVIAIPNIHISTLDEELLSHQHLRSPKCINRLLQMASFDVLLALRNGCLSEVG
jgi:hypothetical protein